MRHSIPPLAARQWQGADKLQGTAVEAAWEGEPAAEDTAAADGRAAASVATVATPAAEHR